MTLEEAMRKDFENFMKDQLTKAYIKGYERAQSERESGEWYGTGSADAVQGCDGCRYNTRTPQKQCLRCKRYWRDSYERKGGDTE